MGIGSITDRLVKLSRSMVGRGPAQLPRSIVLSVFFAGISSSSADAASQVRSSSMRRLRKATIFPFNRHHGGVGSACGHRSSVDPLIVWGG
jgi:TRAP-type C4-dicarboxylate transport system permease large subunit